MNNVNSANQNAGMNNVNSPNQNSGANNSNEMKNLKKSLNKINTTNNNSKYLKNTIISRARQIESNNSNISVLRNTIDKIKAIQNSNSVTRGSLNLQNKLKTMQGFYEFLFKQFKASEKRLKSNIKSVAEKPIKEPWIVVKVGDDNSSIQSVNVASLFNPLWSVNYESTADVFPTAEISKINKMFNTPEARYSANKKVISQKVGPFCASLPNSVNKKWCKKSASERLTIMPSTKNSQGFNLIKNGTAGISVLEVFKRIAPSNQRPAFRRTLLNMKRNGDYSQVFSCAQVNEDGRMYVVRPGTEKLKEMFGNSKNASDAMVNELKQIWNNNLFYFPQLIFWTIDRPACFLARLLRVPYVFQPPQGEFNYVFKGSESIFPFSLSNNSFNKQFNKLMQSYKEYTNTKLPGVPNRNSNQLFNYFKKNDGYPEWFIRMCIIDTCHDFNSTRTGKMSASQAKQVKTRIKDLIKGTKVLGGKVTDGDVEDIWRDIRTIEDNMGVVLRFCDLKVGKKAKANSANYNEFNNLLTINGYGIVKDTGNIPAEFKKRYTTLAAKIADPGN